MIPCAHCHRPTPSHWSPNRPRVYCSMACRDAHWSVIQQARNTDVDQVAVLRLLRGEPVDSTRGERIEATKVLTGRGRTYVQIAAALRVTPQTIWRYHVALNQRKAKP